MTLATRVVSLSGTVVADASAVVPVRQLETMTVAKQYGGHFQLDGLGTRWAHYTEDCDWKYCEGPFYSQDVNWRTGAAAAITTLDPRLHEDLDAAALTVPLCAPLRSDMRSLVDNPLLNGAMFPVALDRPWAVLAGTAHSLRRCGASRPVPLPAHYVAVTLGGGWALLQKSLRYPDSPNTTRLLRLADHHLVDIAGVRSASSYAQAAITAGRVVLTADDADGAQVVYTARLPKR